MRQRALVLLFALVAWVTSFSGAEARPECIHSGISIEEVMEWKPDNFFYATVLSGVQVQMLRAWAIKRTGLPQPKTDTMTVFFEEGHGEISHILAGIQTIQGLCLVGPGPVKIPTGLLVEILYGGRGL